MSDPHEPEKTNEAPSPEQLKAEEGKEKLLPLDLKGEEPKELLSPQDVKASEQQQILSPQDLKAGEGHELSTPKHPTAEEWNQSFPPDKYEQEWIPGEQLELIKIPPPTIWPATLALGTTGMAFGVVTHWILSLAGLFLFLLGAAGWIEDLRNDVL